MGSLMLALVFLLASFLLFSSATSQLKTYIVHVEQPEYGHSETSLDKRTWYESFLPVSTTVMNTSDSELSRILHMYNHVISGFAARLTKEEVNEMSKKEGFLSAQPNRFYKVKTTHTPEFLGLSLQRGAWNMSKLGQGVIIGVLDTGVTPGHPSYHDGGMPPPPSKWKGRCEFNTSVCNNKLIGARYFLSASAAEDPTANITMSPIDEDGHGTHTSSTAAGTFVPYADVLGSASGTASGIAPYSHLAIYRVCSIEDCASADMLAGLDAAIDDGVDVLSISLGDDTSTSFFDDVLAIGSFRAVEHGVFVSCAAGNGGPNASTLFNDAPWILTVAASTHDRSVRVDVNLGNGVVIEDGQSLFLIENSFQNFSSLVYAGNAGKPDSAFCGNGSLDGIDVKGKIVLCERGGGIGRIDKGVFVKNAGGAGMILMNQETEGFSTLCDPHVLPSSHISYLDGLKVKAYINSTTTPSTSLTFKGTVYGTNPSPAITSFSSRGPSIISPGILKPDITGPGVNILAAWPFQIGQKSSGPPFNIISGTSMSAPHLSGIAALVKSVHPDWSPAAIKSAIMTTAQIFDREGKPIVNEQNQPADFFAIGAGHVDPTKATDPGLVYDLCADDYIPYLCGLGFNNNQVKMVIRRPVECSKVRKITESELNYPSISILFSSGNDYMRVERTVKNVGEANSTYWGVVEGPVRHLMVDFEPKILQFTDVNEEKKFKVIFRRTSNGGTNGSVWQGYLKWLSKTRMVRSPISVTF